MSKQILAIGDSGDQLVSKFNNNANECYTKIGTIEGMVYNITDYGCVGDGVTDNTTAFNSLLTIIGSAESTIKIPRGRFLIGSCTIPKNVELIFKNGGRIVWKSLATINIHGYINAGHKWIFENQSEVATDLPTLGIHAQEWVSPIWFGGKMSGDNADALTNYYAFRSAWNAAGRLSQTHMGSSLKFPAGTFIMNGFQNNTDGFNLSAKYADIVGAGKTKTTIMLASGQNKSLWNTYDNFDFNFRDIGFNGNASGNPTMTAPLISIDYYRIYFENVFITNCTADGIYFNAGQTNALNFHNLTVTLCGGTGLIIEDVLCFNISGMIDIESCGGCIDIKQRGNTFNDTRYNMRGMINASVYAEDCTTGIRLFGVSGICAKLNLYMRDTIKVVELKYDTTDYGNGARNMPCFNNVIDVSQSRDEKTLGYQNVYIDENCFCNDIITFPGCRVIDNDGKNKVISRYNKASCQIEISNDFSGINYVEDTHPYYATKYSVENIEESPLPELVAYVPELNAINSLEVSNQIQKVFSHPGGVVYYKCLIKGNAGELVQLQAYDGINFYDWGRKEWTTREALNRRGWQFELNGQYQYFSIPIYSESPKGFVRTIFQPSYGSCRIYYLNITDNKLQGMVHILGGTIIGYNYRTVIVSTALPAASVVNIGTRNFCPDLGMEVISDGTNWRKPDGTILES